jgi:hypothetical protein
VAIVLASQVSPRRRQLEDLIAALNTVTVNAQALAAADLVIGTVTAARDQFSSWLNYTPFGFIVRAIESSRADAYSRLDEAINDVRRYRDDFKGMPQVAVSQTAWDDLKHAIVRAYNVMWAVQDVQGDETEWQALVGFVGTVAVESIQAMPGVIRGALAFTSEVVTDTVGGVAAGLLPLWPLVVVGGVIVVLGVVLVGAGRKKGLIA